MIRSLSLLAALAAALAAVPAARAADAAAAPAAAASAPKKVIKKSSPTTSRQQISSQAKGKALATATVEQMTAGQLDAAARVLDGVAECEFGQKIKVERNPQQSGVFKVSYNKLTYTMVPEETTTGAIRLVDKVAGVVWLQIPIKSMLLNERAGRRMVDMCMQSEQKTANAALQAASGAK